MQHEGVFFRPEGAWVGDVIPFVSGDELLLYYLYEQRTEPKPGTPWHLARTRDLVNFADHGQVLPSGGPDSDDLNAYTGSVVTDDSGLHHLFYTGQNPGRKAPDGRPLQAVMHATSTDLLTWRKIDGEVLGAPHGYDQADWRDPFVFRVPGDHRWYMILAARYAQGLERRRGVIARLVSDDLHHWDVMEPLWAPNRFITMECPEVFQMGEWWYLVFSEFTDAFVTRYRMSRSPNGPWIAPEYDTLDGRSYYAAKSAEREGRRFFFGWIGTREGNTDTGAWEWAGTLSALEATQRADGTLAFHIPEELSHHFQHEPRLALPTQTICAQDSYKAVTGASEVPSCYKLTCDIDFAHGTKATGLLLRADSEGETGYILRLEPQRGRMVLDRWPRPVTGSEQWQISGDVPHFIELERPMALEAGPHHIDLIVDGDILVANVDRAVTLSTRLYDHRAGRIGFFASDGEATISNTYITTFENPQH